MDVISRMKQFNSLVESKDNQILHLKTQLKFEQEQNKFYKESLIKMQQELEANRIELSRFKKNTVDQEQQPIQATSQKD